MFPSLYVCYSITYVHSFISVPVVAGIPAITGIHAVADATVTAVAGVTALDDGLLLLAMQSKLLAMHDIDPLNSP